jgi:hypothetical protein
MRQNDGNQTRPITWYVLEPRDESCAVINPKLWKEYRRLSGINSPQDIHTERFCVQWLDQWLTDQIQKGISDDRYQDQF